MSWNVYVIANERGNLYVGSTGDLVRRIAEHNRGQSRSTRGKGPWRIVYAEEYRSSVEAKRRELEIKRKKSRKYIDALIGRGLVV